VEKGYTADLVILDYAPPTPLESANVAGHMIFGMNGSHVETVIVNGKIVMEKRRFPWDTDPIYKEARESALALWGAMDRL
jgi:cytosine/adenosine deaminase-related metal-dependent hydrolase